MITIKLGNKKRQFKSIRLAAEAAGMKPITFYMRLRAGMPVTQAMRMPVRVYNRKESV